MGTLFKKKNTTISLICQLIPLISAIVVVVLIVIGGLMQDTEMLEGIAVFMMVAGFVVMAFGMPLFALCGIVGIVFSVRALRKKESKIPNIILITLQAVMSIAAVYGSYFIWFIAIPSV